MPYTYGMTRYSTYTVPELVTAYKTAKGHWREAIGTDNAARIHGIEETMDVIAAEAEARGEAAADEFYAAM